jgi:hypothetical protein
MLASEDETSNVIDAPQSSIQAPPEQPPKDTRSENSRQLSQNTFQNVFPNINLRFFPRGERGSRRPASGEIAFNSAQQELRYSFTGR